MCFDVNSMYPSVMREPLDLPAFFNFPNVYFIAKMSHFTVETQPQKCLGTVQKCFDIGEMF